VLDHAFMLVPAQAAFAKRLESFKESPPSQKPASFSIDQVIQKMTEASGSN
jgi:arylsulfatase